MADLTESLRTLLNTGGKMEFYDTRSDILSGMVSKIVIIFLTMKNYVSKNKITIRIT